MTFQGKIVKMSAPAFYPRFVVSRRFVKKSVVAHNTLLQIYIITHGNSKQSFVEHLITKNSLIGCADVAVLGIPRE